MTEEKRKVSVSRVEDEKEKKLKYPKSVFFIVSNEFCERFSYYGMRTILSIYLTDMLLFSEGDAKITYHTFTMLVYFFPIFGAMLADSILGKFRTIFYISIIYAIGNMVLSLAATPPLNLPQVAFSIIGLLLIAIGTGGIKPCVAAFGGDQFVLPQQEKQLAAFFSMFYFAINFGSFVSTFLTPILREQECFGSDQCFTLAFGVPGVLMVISIIIFASGKKLYRIRKPEGNMVIKVSKCIGNAIKTKSKSKTKKEHWLDYAEEKYGAKLVNDVKATLRVLVLYIPLPVFWALFDQQGTGWTFQARRMDGDIGFYTILPDQMQVVNPILILAFIPLFEYGIYPLLNKMNLLRKPLQRLVAGGVLAAISFAVSALIAMAIEAENPILPSSGNGHLILYNTNPCAMTVVSSELGQGNININPYDYRKFEIKMSGSKTYPFDILGDCFIGQPGKFELKETEAKLYYWNQNAFIGHNESLAKDDKGSPRLLTLYNGPTADLKYINDEGNVVAEMKTDVINRVALSKPGSYQINIGGKDIMDPIKVKLGGVYTFIVAKEDDGSFGGKVLEVTSSNSIHMLWIIPQYIIITMGEIMFSITGLEFSYSQAPISMKSVLQACWLLTTAFGNLIVVIIESADVFEKQSYNFFLYAGLMVVDMIIFSLMAMRYKYVEKDTGEDSSDETEKIEEKKSPNGIDNVAFTDKEP